MLPTDTEDVPAGSAALEDEAAEPERMVLFVVGEHRFAVPIGRIREIIPARPYTPLPGSGGHVCGLINLRGRIVTVVDLGARLGLPPASRIPEHSIVIVEHHAKLVGLAVEEVARIVAVDPGSLADSADVLRSLRIDRAYLRGVGEVDDEIFVAVEPDEIFEPILA
ncbi:MAG TPA: chemotaxis protein CheW [Longimicrobium sp.]